MYRAEHVHNRQVVAIKVLDLEYSKHPEVAARFQREVQAYRRIRHAHVVAAIDFGRLDDECLYMVLEFIEGHDLRDLLGRTHHLDSARAAKIAYQVTLALVAAHAIGVVHRDLKPENIMLITRDGDPDYVKVVDFGIAKVPTAGAALTALGSVFGTPEYMAPEQARGGQVDARTDLYTVGTVLYEMLAGMTPFASANISEVIIAQITKEPPPLPALVDRELATIVMQLLAKDPAKRVQTSTELAERLRQVVQRLAPELLAAGPPASSQATSRERPLPPLPAAPLPPLTTPTPPIAYAATPAPPQVASPAPQPNPAPAAPTAPATTAQKSSGWLALVLLVGIFAALGWLLRQLF